MRRNQMNTERKGRAHELRNEYRRRIQQIAVAVLATPAIFLAGKEILQNWVLYLLVPVAQSFLLLMIAFNIFNLAKYPLRFNTSSQPNIFWMFGLFLDRIIAFLFSAATFVLGGSFYFRIDRSAFQQSWFWCTTDTLIILLTILSLIVYVVATVKSRDSWGHEVLERYSRLVSVLLGAIVGLLIAWYLRGAPIFMPQNACL